MVRTGGDLVNFTAYAAPGCGHAQRYFINFSLFVLSFCEQKKNTR
jgi:hypothetical protein